MSSYIYYNDDRKQICVCIVHKSEVYEKLLNSIIFNIITKQTFC